MMIEFLAPCMQYDQDADLRAQMLGIGGQLFDRLRHGTHEDAINLAFVLQGNWADVVRQSNYHVKVRNWQQLGRAGLQPFGSLHGLALGTVTVAARVIQQQFVAQWSH